MSNKAKKSKQKKLGDKQLTIRRNRIRGMVKDYSLSDAEADFYYNALKSKETPIQFLTSTADNVRSLVDKFNVIRDINKEASVMDALTVIDKGLHESIVKANEYLESVLADTQNVVDANSEGLQASEDEQISMLTCGPIIEAFSSIQDELAENAPNLMQVIAGIYKAYVDLEKHTAKDEPEVNNEVEEND